jgi:hypothetical protein
MSAPPAQIALAPEENRAQVNIMLLCEDGSALTAVLARDHQEDADADLLALRDEVWAAAVCTWWRAQQPVRVH